MTKAKKAGRKRIKPLKLDLGCGPTLMKDYTPLDINMENGVDVFEPLEYPTGSVAAIRASHILEHASYKRTLDVLKEWVRVLKPDGWIKIAVPDLDAIIAGYNENPTGPYNQLIMGGHDNPNDCHGAIFTSRALRTLMRFAGLIDIVRWDSDNADCSANPISLNLKGRKLPAKLALECAKPIKVGCAMSVPRLAFQVHWGCAYKALSSNSIPIYKYTGAYWEQGIEGAIEEVIDQGHDFILTTDYDSVYTKEDVLTLIHLMRTHPKIDAITSLESGRSTDLPLMTVKDEKGESRGRISRAELENDLFGPINTAHFGLTLIRASSMKTMKHPWFWSKPNKQGRWKEGKTDADIGCWVKWMKSGRTLFLAPHVVIGHLVEMVKWPGRDLKAIHSDARQYPKEGKPAGVWL